MKLVSFLKIAKLHKLDNAEKFDDKLLVFACAENAGERAASNYRVLQKKYDLQEENFDGNKYLLVDQKNQNIGEIQKDLQVIEDVDILDDEDYRSLKKEKKTERSALVKNLGQCSFCGKTLTTESSLVSSMGPVCESKAHQIEEEVIPLSSYNKFKPLGAISLKKGDSVILQTEEKVGFYEFVEQSNDSLTLIDRKKMNALIKTSSPMLALSESLCVVPLVDVRGVCSPSDMGEQKKGLWDQWIQGK